MRACEPRNHHPVLTRRAHVIELELERTVSAPIHDVFARLADIDGYNDWMPDSSLMRHTHQTSSGEPTLGTTFLEETASGTASGEIVVFNAPRALIFHWWEESRSGKVRTEGWPGYALEVRDDGRTFVRHEARMHSYGIWRLASPVLRRMAVKERTTTLDALVASFEQGGHSGTQTLR